MQVTQEGGCACTTQSPVRSDGAGRYQGAHLDTLNPSTAVAPLYLWAEVRLQGCGGCRGDLCGQLQPLGGTQRDAWGAKGARVRSRRCARNLKALVSGTLFSIALAPSAALSSSDVTRLASIGKRHRASFPQSSSPLPTSSRPVRTRQAGPGSPKPVPASAPSPSPRTNPPVFGSTSRKVVWRAGSHATPSSAAAREGSACGRGARGHRAPSRSSIPTGLLSRGSSATGLVPYQCLNACKRQKQIRESFVARKHTTLGLGLPGSSAAG